MKEEQFLKKRKTTDLIMTLWSLVVFLFFLSDIAVNYVYQYILMHDEFKTERTTYMQVSYWFVSVQFILLTVLILWQTCLLIRVIRIMGNRLAAEQSRLKILMYIFAFSYILVGGYYIFRVTLGLSCTNLQECIRFQDLMVKVGIQFLFDVLPMAVLFYQHYKTSKQSLYQLNQQKK